MLAIDMEVEFSFKIHRDCSDVMFLPEFQHAIELGIGIDD
jgi:hypothetical protein